MAQAANSQKRKLVEAAVKLLADDGIGADPQMAETLSRFALALFREGAAEDLVTYSAAELAAIAQEAYERIADRRSGERCV